MPTPSLAKTQHLLTIIQEPAKALVWMLLGAFLTTYLPDCLSEERSKDLAEKHVYNMLREMEHNAHVATRLRRLEPVDDDWNIDFNYMSFAASKRLLNNDYLTDVLPDEAAISTLWAYSTEGFALQKRHDEYRNMAKKYGYDLATAHDNRATVDKFRQLVIESANGFLAICIVLQRQINAILSSTTGTMRFSDRSFQERVKNNQELVKRLYHKITSGSIDDIPELSQSPHTKKRPFLKN